jgi:hypothetical protein
VFEVSRENFGQRRVGGLFILLGVVQYEPVGQRLTGFAMIRCAEANALCLSILEIKPGAAPSLGTAPFGKPELSELEFPVI